MPVGADTHVYRGRMQHLARRDKTYFVTFCSAARWELPPIARDLALNACIDGHRKDHWLGCVVIMPDHVHLIITPYERTNLPTVIGRIKGASSFAINRRLARKGAVWQRDYFDRIVRSDENLTAKAEYIANNPVRQGLVERAEDWPWWWSSWSGGL